MPTDRRNKKKRYLKIDHLPGNAPRPKAGSRGIHIYGTEAGGTEMVDEHGVVTTLIADWADVPINAYTINEADHGKTIIFTDDGITVTLPLAAKRLVVDLIALSVASDCQLVPAAGVSIFTGNGTTAIDPKLTTASVLTRVVSDQDGNWRILNNYTAIV